MAITRHAFRYGEQEIILETGRMACQASGAVMVRSGGSAILVTVVAVEEVGSEFRSFLPLTVNYQERAYAVGSIPGGFLKREGRSTEREILISRLMDRPLRPSFPKGFCNEVQVIATVMSLEADHNADVLAMIGASAAIGVAGLPFNGPVAAARVGYQAGHFILNPSPEKTKASQLDLAVAGTKKAVLMVESQAKELSEEIMLNAVLFGHEQMQVAIREIDVFIQKADSKTCFWNPTSEDTSKQEKVRLLAMDSIIEAYGFSDKAQRQKQLRVVHQKVMDTLCNDSANTSSEALTVEEVKAALYHLEKAYVRQRVLENHKRIDGRDLDTIRQLDLEVGVLDRTHGSAYFARGETKAIVVTTLGTARDARIIDDLSDVKRQSFMLHYNFPPYSVGEIGFIGAPKRREIGHGYLAKYALLAVMPTEETFPYVIRVVSEITDSNGSSSMATVCGASMALMDAGVPIKSAVAGIAMGLIKEGDRFAVLTDILGDEDHLGDMDFKVAGTLVGVTALQMDIKIDGITPEIMSVALKKARQARFQLLERMQAIINKPRDDVSRHAPKFLEFKILPEKIREVIGRGGSIIRELTEKTGATIDVSDDGTIKIGASDTAVAEHAKQLIDEIVNQDTKPARRSAGARGEAQDSGPPLQVGDVCEGKVVKLMDFGAFIALRPGKDGFLHISEIRSDRRVYDINEELEEGQLVKVKVVGIDERQRVRLSIKALVANPA